MKYNTTNTISYADKNYNFLNLLPHKNKKNEKFKLRRIFVILSEISILIVAETCQVGIKEKFENCTVI
jgi:hypothetical protein